MPGRSRARAPLLARRPPRPRRTAGRVLGRGLRGPCPVRRRRSAVTPPCSPCTPARGWSQTWARGSSPASSPRRTTPACRPTPTCAAPCGPTWSGPRGRCIRTTSGAASCRPPCRCRGGPGTASRGLTAGRWQAGPVTDLDSTTAPSRGSPPGTFRTPPPPSSDAAARRGPRGDADRVFRVASVGKLLAGYAIMIGVEEGAVALDDPAGPPGATLRHLLAHAAGYGFESDAGRGRRAGDAPGVLQPRDRGGRGPPRAGRRDAVRRLPRRGRARAARDARTELRGSPRTPLHSTVGDLPGSSRELQAPTPCSAPRPSPRCVAVQFPGLAGVLPGRRPVRPAATGGWASSGTSAATGPLGGRPRSARDASVTSAARAPSCGSTRTPGSACVVPHRPRVRALGAAGVARVVRRACSPCTRPATPGRWIRRRDHVGSRCVRGRGAGPHRRTRAAARGRSEERPAHRLPPAAVRPGGRPPARRTPSPR